MYLVWRRWGSAVLFIFILLCFAVHKCYAKTKSLGIRTSSFGNLGILCNNNGVIPIWNLIFEKLNWKKYVEFWLAIILTSKIAFNKFVKKKDIFARKILH